MTAPDLSTLAARMRWAADVLEEAAKRYDYPYPETTTWSASALRIEADHVEAEDKEAAEKDALVEDLAGEVFEAEIPSKKWNAGKGSGGPEHYRRVARKLIDNGWTRA